MRPPDRKRRRERLLLGVVLVPLLLLSLARWLVDPVAFTNRHLDRIEQFAQQVLEQKLSIGSVQGHLYPELDVTVSDLVLSSKVAGDPPMLMLPLLRIRFRLQRALATFGRELPLESVQIEGGVLRVRRDGAGHLDIVDVVKKLPPIDLHDLAGGVLSGLTINHAQVHFVDASINDGHQGAVVVDDFHLETRGPVALGEPLVATATAAWGDVKRPASVEVRIDAVPADLVFWPPPVATLQLVLPNTDLVSGFAWLGLPQLFSGGAVDVAINAATSPDAITAVVDIAGAGLSAVVSTGAGAGVERSGAESEASLRGEVRVAVDGFRTEINNLAFKGAGIDVEGNAVFLQWSLDGVESIDAIVRAEELARLGLLIPPLRNTAPGALQVSGEGAGFVHASPSHFSCELDLDGARLAIGEVLSKRPGERLGVVLVGTRDSEAAFIAGELTASSASSASSAPGRIDAAVQAELPRGVHVDGAFVFQPAGVDVAHFDLRSQRTTLAKAAAMSPAVHDIVDGSVRSGSLAASMHGRMSVDDDVFDFQLHAQGLRVEVDSNQIGGSALVHVTTRTDTRGMSLNIAANLDELSIETRNGRGQTLFFKPLGTTLRLQASLVESGGRGSLGRALQELDATAHLEDGLFVGDGLSPRWRRFALGLDGRGSLQAAHLELLGVALDNVDLKLSLRQGRLTFDSAILHLLSGRASLGGSVVDLGALPPRWSVGLDLPDVELARLLLPLQALTGAVRGTVGVRATLRATGFFLESLLGSLDGPVVMSTHDVSIARVDDLSRAIAKAWDLLAWLPGVSQTEVARARGTSLSETLRQGEWAWGLHGSQLRVDKPTQTSLGLLTLAGHAGLDGSIELSARLDLEVAVAKWLSAPGESLPLLATVNGTWTRPILSFTSFDQLSISAVVRELGRHIQETSTEMKRAFDVWLLGSAAIDP